MSVVPSEPGTKLAHSMDLSNKVVTVFQTRARLAQERLTERVQRAFREQVAGAALSPMLPWDLAMSWTRYATDAAQRWVLFWDSLRQRGNIHLADKPRGAEREAAEIAPDVRELAFVKEALASIEDGGYPEALARMSALLGRDAETIPLGRLESNPRCVATADEAVAVIREHHGRWQRTQSRPAPSTA